MPRSPSLRCAALLVGALACADAPRAGAPGTSAPVWDARAGAFVTPEALFARAAQARFLLLGERHDHPEHHRLQAEVVRALVARGRRPAVAFEMLPADAAPALAAVLAGPAPTPEAVRSAVDWDHSGWPPFALYAPVFAAALEAGLPLRAADLPRGARRAAGRRGLAGLAPDLAALAPAPLPAPVRAALAEEIRTSHCGYAPEDRIGAMVELQWARDAHLAAALLDAAGAHGAVLVAGAGHVRRDRAVPLHLARMAPGADVVSIAFLEAPPSGAGDAALLAEAADAFDYAWLTPPLDAADPCEKFRPALERLREGAPPAP